MPNKPTGSEGRRVAINMQKALNEAHETLDHAITHSAALLATALMSRRDAGLPSVAGQAEISALARGLTQMVDTRGSYIDVHASIASIGVQQGLITRSEGDLADKRIIQDGPQLHVVPGGGATSA